MKKAICLLLCIILSLSAASAEGLNGLMGGGLSGLVDAMEGITLPLPDPTEKLGYSGKLIRENYQYSPDFLCDAYFYPGVDGDSFSSSYIELAEESGFTVTQEVADGLPSYRLEQKQTGLYALLVPEFQGGALLLVHVDLAFGSSSAENEPAQQDAIPVHEFMTYTYNDTNYTMWPKSTNAHEIEDDEIELNFFSDQGIISYLSINLPYNIHSGDDFVTTQYEGTTGLKFYISGNTPFNNAQGKSSSFYAWNSNNDDGSLVASQGDYFHLHVNSVQVRNRTMEIYGSFDGQFYRAKEFFNDGEFFAIVPFS